MNVEWHSDWKSFNLNAEPTCLVGIEETCGACGPVIGEQGEGDQEQDENKQQEQQGPLTEQSRIKYFMRVKLKRLKQLQRRQDSSSSSRGDRSR